VSFISSWNCLLTQLSHSISWNPSMFLLPLCICGNILDHRGKTRQRWISSRSRILRRCGSSVHSSECCGCIPCFLFGCVLENGNDKALPPKVPEIKDVLSTQLHWHFHRQCVSLRIWCYWPFQLSGINV
jgi:hypothetical protein